MEPARSWSGVFPGTLDGVRASARWLDGVSAEGGFPDEMTNAIQVCVEELVTNTARHGGGQWPPQDAPGPGERAAIEVRIAVRSEEGAVTVVLEDTGAAFDVAAAMPHRVEGSLAETQPGGLGILLVKEFSDELHYERVAGMNRVSLKFCWPRAGSTLL